jgi:cell wall-associated NlpC family hydrolase
VAPPPRPLPTPQEAALDRALKEFAKAPYRSGGVSPAGVDCSGLVMAVYQRLGLALPRTAADQFTTGEPVPPGRLRFGDVVFFNRLSQVKKSGPYLANMLPPATRFEVCHNGIYIGGGASSTPLPGGWRSAGWTPRSGGRPFSGPGGFSSGIPRKIL